MCIYPIINSKVTLDKNQIKRILINNIMYRYKLDLGAIDYISQILIEHEKEIIDD